MSEDIRAILAELKDDHSFAYQMYKEYDGDTLTISIIDEFNEHPFVEENKSLEIEEKNQIKLVQEMVKGILSFFGTSYDHEKKGTDFNKAVQNLEKAKSILKKPENSFCLINERWIYKDLEKIINHLNGNTVKKNQRKNYFSVYVAENVFKAWQNMGRETTFYYKGNGKYDYTDKEPATPFTAFVQAVVLELGNVTEDYHDLEETSFSGLKENIDALNKKQKQ